MTDWDDGTVNHAASVAWNSGACWLAAHGVYENGDQTPPCEGRLVRVHLIAQQILKREGGEPGDPRSYVMACGGLTGVGGHHGDFDSTRKLRVPYAALPADLRALADELNLDWWLRRNYA